MLFNLGENNKTIENYKSALKLNSNNFKLIEMIAEKLNESLKMKTMKIL